MTTFQIDITADNGTPSYIFVNADTDTLADAQALAAQFPKSYGLRASKYTRYNKDAAGRILDSYDTGTVRIQINLVGNGVNGGRNETGIDKYNRIVRKARALGHAVEYTPRFGNSYATLVDAEAALAR